MTRTWFTIGWRVAVVAILYLGATELSLLYRGDSASPLWPPSGLALAALLVWGRWMGLGVGLGAMLSALGDGNPATFSAIMAANNVLEAWLAQSIIHRISPEALPLRHFRDVWALLLAALGASAVPAVIGAFTLKAYGFVGPSASTVGLGYWTAHALGILVLTPPLVEWVHVRRRVFDARFWMEAVGLGLAAFSVSWLVLWRQSAAHLPFAYLVFPPLTWAAWRFGARGATAVSVWFAATTLWGTALGLGPFAGRPLVDTVALLQIFLLVMSVTSVLLGISAQETQNALDRADASRVESEANLVQLTTTLRELTDARDHERRALLQSDSLKTALLSLVSHELRTPLTSVRTSISSVLGQTLPAATTQELLSGALEDVDYLTGLVENLLDMSRIEAGTVSAERHWIPCEELVEIAVRRVGPPLDSPRFDIDIEADLPPLHVDAFQLQLVLVNLLDNAVKYAPADGRIRLTARREAESLVVRVANEGPSLPAGERERVFERFYRADRPQGTPVRGLGLGLAIARAAVESHGGRIWVDGDDPGWTTFAFSVPLEPLDEPLPSRVPILSATR
ncbi:MAG: MASE1 domain-containing protein [Vicinamibacterales bacterium]